MRGEGCEGAPHRVAHLALQPRWHWVGTRYTVSMLVVVVVMALDSTSACFGSPPLTTARLVQVSAVSAARVVVDSVLAAMVRGPDYWRRVVIRESWRKRSPGAVGALVCVWLLPSRAPRAFLKPHPPLPYPSRSETRLHLHAPYTSRMHNLSLTALKLHARPTSMSILCFPSHSFC